MIQNIRHCDVCRVLDSYDICRAHDYEDVAKVYCLALSDVCYKLLCVIDFAIFHYIYSCQVPKDRGYDSAFESDVEARERR